MIGYKRKFEVSTGSILQPDRQYATIIFQPNGYWDTDIIVVRSVIENGELEVTITNAMGGQSEYDVVARAKSFAQAYDQAIRDIERINDFFQSGLRDLDDIIDQVQDQYLIDTHS